jgi:CDP-glucose 4,6-dehydratase
MPDGSWRGQKVFVTGATGLVGSWLVRELVESGAHCVVLMHDWNPQSELIRSGVVNATTVVNGALEDFNSLERAINRNEIRTVFHLGAQPIVSVAHRNPLQTFESNIRGTYNLLEACRLHSSLVKRILVASSDKAYGQAENLPYTEDMPLAGKQPYEVSKTCADLIAQSFACAYQLPVAIARCGNIFGGGDLNWSRLIPSLIRSLIYGEIPIIRSDGHSLRDYIYVKDVVSAYIKLAEKIDRTPEISGEAFNFSPGKPQAVLELTAMILRIMDCESVKPTILNQAGDEIKSQYLDSTKARRELDWSPGFTIESGLAETILWYREFFHQQAND